jgi:hypothetical protein
MSDNGPSVVDLPHAVDDIFPTPRWSQNELLGSDECPMSGTSSTGPDACIGVAMGFGSWGQYLAYGS